MKIAKFLLSVLILQLVACKSSDLAKARIALEIGDHERAQNFYANILNDDPANVEARYGMALSYYSQAQERNDNGLVSDSSWLKAHQEFEILRKLTDSTDYFDHFHAYSLFYLGRDAEMNRNFEQALRFANQSIAYDSTMSFSFNLAGVCYLRLGQKQAAISAFKKSIQNDSLFAAGYLNLGQLYEQYGQYEDAWLCYEDGIVQLPNHSTLLARSAEMQDLLATVLDELMGSSN